MDEKKFLANFAKILGAESTFEELEQKRLKEERLLASLSKSLGAEDILEDIKKKEDQLIENMNVTLSKYQAAEQQAIIDQVNKELEEVKEQLVEDAKQEEPEIPASVFNTPAVEKIAKEKPKKEDIVPPSLRKELDYIKKSITDFHRFAQRHSQMGGGGAAWLWDLGDVSNDVKNALDGQVLTFNVVTNKWVAATPTSGGASGNTTNLFAYVTNDEDVTIHKGDPVYLYRATGNRPSVKLGYNTGDATSAKTMGLAAEDITAHNPGWVMVRGVLTGVDTSAYNEGDTLYLGSTAGTLTSSKPYAPNHLVYIGVVVRANQGQGQIYIQPQNGYELDEIHDVNINHNVALANGHTLLYNSNNSLWENRSLSGLVATLTANSAAYLDGVAANQYAYSNSSVNINGTNVTLNGSANVNSLINGSDTLSLDGTNKVNLPGGTSYIFSATNNITIASDNTNSNYLEIINNVGATISTDRSFEIRTNADGTDKVWSFTQGGSLFFPDSTYQTTAWTGSVATLTSNNSLFLGGIAANQYAYANQITTYTLPTANTTTLGGVKVDGTTITVANGVISSPNQDLSGYQTSAGLSANVATLTSNNALYLGGTAANGYAKLGANANFDNVTATTVSSNASVAFIAGIAANSGVALQMPHEGALRNMSNTSSTMYFDVNNGGSAHGYFNFRSSNNFTSILHLGVSQVTFNSGAAVSGQSPYVGRTSFNVALDTVVTVDNIKYRISNQGGIFPQIASASGSATDVCYDVLGVVNGSGTTNAQNSGYILLADGTWLSIYSSHGLDSRGDRLTAHITDKAAGKIYRVTFLVTNNSSNVTGYNIIVERVL